MILIIPMRALCGGEKKDSLRISPHTISLRMTRIIEPLAQSCHFMPQGAL